MGSKKRKEVRRAAGVSEDADEQARTALLAAQLDLLRLSRYVLHSHATAALMHSADCFLSLAACAYVTKEEAEQLRNASARARAQALVQLGFVTG